jgi:hypothetical protein
MAVSARTPRPKTAKPRAKFSVETLEALAKDLQSGRTPLDKLTVSDDEVSGLRPIVRNTGAISYHVTYSISGSRPYLLLGHHPEMTIRDARELAKTVQALAERGIDPQEGLHSRLIRELREKGTRWRP